MSQNKDQQKGSKPEGGPVNALRDIQEEFLQIAELTSMEKNYAKELSNCLRQVTSVLKFSVPISTEVFPMPVKQAALSSEGNVLVTQENGPTSSKPLEEFDSETAVKIIGDALPKLRVAASNYRKKIASRVTLLEEVMPELRRLVRAIQEEKVERPEGAIEDAVGSSISTPYLSESSETAERTAEAIEDQPDAEILPPIKPTHQREKSLAQASVNRSQTSPAPTKIPAPREKPPSETPDNQSGTDLPTSIKSPQNREKIRLSWENE